nr:MAG TPA: hypothetical protein [Microviridae sp.]
MFLLHTRTNLGSDLLRLLKTVQTEIRRGIDNLRAILVVVRITKRTGTKAKTTITERANLIRKRFNTMNQLIARSRIRRKRTRTRRHTFVKILIAKHNRKIKWL